MAIFKRSEKNSSPQARVFTPDDLGALGAPPAQPAAPTMTLPAPPAPPAAPMVDGVMGGTPGLSMPSAPPSQPSAMPVSPLAEAAPRPSQPMPEPPPMPERATPEPPAPASIPIQSAPAPEPTETLAPPPFVESEFVPSAPSAVMPEYTEPAPDPEPVLSADRTETTYPTSEPEAQPDAAAHVDPAMQDLAHRVSQALVDLEELRGQKEDLESQLAALQRQHGDLDRKIEQQRKVVTELLAQVHKVIVGDEAPQAPVATEPKPDTPPEQPRPHRQRR